MKKVLSAILILGILLAVTVVFVGYSSLFQAKLFPTKGAGRVLARLRQVNALVVQPVDLSVNGILLPGNTLFQTTENTASILVESIGVSSPPTVEQKYRREDGTLVTNTSVATQVAQVSGTIYFLAEGFELLENVHMKFTIDPGNAVQEADEDNNERCVNIRVSEFTNVLTVFTLSCSGASMTF